MLPARKGLPVRRCGDWEDGHDLCRGLRPLETRSRGLLDGGGSGRSTGSSGRSRKAPWDASRAPFYGWFSDGVCNTCHNAVDRHVAAGNGEQTAIIYDQPGDRDEARRSPMPSSRTGWRGSPARWPRAVWARATGSSSTCRWSPRRSWRCSPARGSARSIRSSSAASPRASSQCGSTMPTPKAVIAASCGIEPGGSSPTSRSSTLRSRMAQRTSPDFCVILQREQAMAGAERGPRPRLARLPGRRRARRLRAGRAERTRSTSSTPPERPASPRASCAPTPATSSRSPGRCSNIYAIAPGEVFWAASDVGWVVGHSYICYAPLLVGATTVVFEGKPVGTPDAGTFWRVIAEHGVPQLLHRADRLPRDQARGPERRAAQGPRPERTEAPLPRGRAGRSRHHRLGGAAPQGAGDRPLVADRDRLADRSRTRQGSSFCRSSPARPLVPMPGYEIDILSEAGARLRPGSSAPSRSGCRFRRGRCRRSGTPTTVSNGPTSRTYPGYYETGDAGMLRRGRLPLHHGAHRRRHQRRRPPALHRRDGGSARRATPTLQSAR